MSAESRETATMGFLNFINLIPKSETSTVLLDGKDIVNGGLSSGNESGWFALPAGSMRLTAKTKQSREAGLAVNLVAGATQLYVVYIEKVERLKPDGTPYPPKLVIKEFPTFKPSGKSLRLVSLHKEEREFSIMKEFITLRPRQIVKSGKWNGQGFFLNYRNKPFGKVLASEENTSHYVFIAPDMEGKSFIAQATADKIRFK